MTTTQLRSPIAARSLLAGLVLMVALFLQAGYGKLMNFAGTVAYASSAGMPLPVSV